MSTLAGTHGTTPPPDESPRNRAVDALECAGPPNPAPNFISELDRHLAAGAIALAIRANQALLTERERIILAAALLPEFAVLEP